MTVKPKVSQSTDCICCGSQYISNTALNLCGMANYTLHARITTATLIQGARMDIRSHQLCCQCPLTQCPYEGSDWCQL
jgi:hypothetical protein